VVSVLAESLLLGLVGGVLGGGLAYAGFNGYQASTINWQTFSQVAFAFRVTPLLLVQGTGYALILGLVGGSSRPCARRESRWRPRCGSFERTAPCPEAPAAFNVYAAVASDWIGLRRRAVMSETTKTVSAEIAAAGQARLRPEPIRPRPRGRGLRLTPFGAGYCGRGTCSWKCCSAGSATPTCTRFVTSGKRRCPPSIRVSPATRSSAG